MAGRTTTKAIVYGASRIPGVRRLPVLRLLAIGEIGLLARSHLSRLEPGERQRLIALLRAGRGNPRRLSTEDRDELQRLVAKTEPRLFAGMAADMLSPVPLPRRLVHGRKRRA